MKLIKFKASKVYGHLDFFIDFHSDLTFLTGLNGSGKTTVLRLIMAIMGTSLEVLSDIDFETTELQIGSADEKIKTIFCKKSRDKLSIRHSEIHDPIEIPLPPDRSLIDRGMLLDYYSNTEMKIRQDSVIKAIRQHHPPTFLGIDRKSIDFDRISAEEVALQNQMRRHTQGPRQIPSTAKADSVGGLSEVQNLLRDAILKVRKRQNELDDILRNKVILDSFSLINKSDHFPKFPTSGEIAVFRKKKDQITDAIRNLGIPSNEVESKIKDFMDEIGQAVEAIEEFEDNGNKKRANKKPEHELLMKWILNSSQIERVSRLLTSCEQYIIDRSRVEAPIDNFIGAVNRFLTQTNKKISVSTQDYLEVVLPGENRRPISAMSSGERQILVMFAHLSFSKYLEKPEGIYIVDEPELSLHISWQEQFVDAVKDVSPKTQIIVATHSPAIIAGRNDNCVDVSLRRE
jgi:predicted ATPase